MNRCQVAGASCSRGAHAEGVQLDDRLCGFHRTTACRTTEDECTRNHAELVELIETREDAMGVICPDGLQGDAHPPCCSVSGHDSVLQVLQTYV
jgi:hypothetical protein